IGLETTGGWLPGGARLGAELRARLGPEPEQQAKQQHCRTEVRRDELLSETVFDGESAEPRLDQNQDPRDQRAAEGPAISLPQVLVGAPAEQRDQNDDDGGEQPVGELDDPVLIADQRDHLTAAEGPALGAAASRAAAESGLAHAHDPADDDQQE